MSNKSLGFSSFRVLLDQYDEILLKEAKEKEHKKSKVKNVIDGQNLIMFFKNQNSIFGSPEHSRIVFAQMKNPTDEMPDINFSALDLVKALSGDSSENLFSLEDLPKINIITRDEAENQLMKCPCGKSINPVADDDIGQIKLKDADV